MRSAKRGYAVSGLICGASQRERSMVHTIDGITIVLALLAGFVVGASFGWFNAFLVIWVHEKTQIEILEARGRASAETRS
jgi:hypothetical protein